MGKKREKGNFLSGDDFEPALIPPKKIADPDDKKPEDWDERAKIPDPDAVKPDDWDEDAEEIEDEEAVKPEDWLDDEPEKLMNPEPLNQKIGMTRRMGYGNHRRCLTPSVWRRHLDVCEWIRPTKKNPAYKGKWHAPLIDNPATRVLEAAADTKPNYFELDRPEFELLLLLVLRSGQCRREYCLITFDSR
ncbi:calnexin-like protein [Iris pallida]|uniref:Calnexin-like protein n=1 Tax=Iris pallida TaxID=29817 RepID=A0AAX6I6P5_IRIPA|nr:calnexin-like protein [Iris pallida]